MSDTILDAPMPPLAAGLAFHHVGVACRDLRTEAAHWQLLGYRSNGRLWTDREQGVQLQFMEGGGPCVELIAPLEGSTVLDPYLTSGSKLYHFGFVAVDFDRAFSTVNETQRLVSPPRPAVAFGGGRVAFFLLRNLLLIELIENLQP